MLLAFIMEGKAEDGLNTGLCGATFDPDRRRSPSSQLLLGTGGLWTVIAKALSANFPQRIQRLRPLAGGVQAAHDKIEALERVIAGLDGGREAALAGFLRTLASTPLGNRSTSAHTDR
jgi:hypothetical protein